MSRLLLCLIALLCSVGSLRAQEWNRFRGPNGSGISETKTIPTSWGDEDYLWKVELPGVGHGSPVAWDQSVYVNCALDDGARRILQCRSMLNGSLIWETEFESTTHKHHKFNSYATSTPTVDGDHIYSAWGTPSELKVVAVRHDGSVAWESDNLGPVVGGHGFGTSPIVHGNLVLIANDTEKKSSLLALDRMTGKVVWETPRQGGRLNFATPCIFTNGDSEQAIFVAWPIGVTAVDVKTGQLVWEKACFDASKGQRAVSSPSVYQDKILATSAFANNPKHLVVLRPEQSDAQEVFRVDHSTVPHIPSLLAYEERVYAWSDKGIASCYDINSGELVWRERVGGNFFSSPICVNGIIYCIDADGICVVTRAGDEYEELARVDLGEATRATPAVAQGKMFLRTFSHLMAVGQE